MRTFTSVTITVLYCFLIGGLLGMVAQPLPGSIRQVEIRLGPATVLTVEPAPERVVETEPADGEVGRPIS